MQLSRSLGITFVVCLLATPFLAAAAKDAAKDKTNPPSQLDSSTTIPEEIDGQNFNDWLKKLNSPDPSVRTEAIMAILQFGRDKAGEAVPHFLRHIRDLDTGVRIKIVVALRMVNIREDDIDDAVKALCGRLSTTTESQSAVRYEAAATIQALGKRAKSAIPTLAGGVIDSGAWEIRQLCVFALREIGSPDPPKKGERPNNGARGPDAVATNALLVAINDPSDNVRLQAIVALGAMGRPANPAMLKRVVDALEFKSTKSYNTIHRIWAYVALAKGLAENVSKDSVKAIAHYTYANMKLTKAKRTRVRIEALNALGVIGRQSRLHLKDVLEQLKDDEITVVVAAYHATEAITGRDLEKDDPPTRDMKAGIDAILGFLKKGRDLHSRMQAAAAVAAIGPRARQAIPDLVSLLDDDDTKLVVVGCMALTQLKDTSKPVVEGLLKALKHKEKEVVMAAASSFVALECNTPEVLDALSRRSQDPGLDKNVKDALVKMHDGLKKTKTAKKDE